MTSISGPSADRPPVGPQAGLSNEGRTAFGQAADITAPSPAGRDAGSLDPLRTLRQSVANTLFAAGDQMRRRGAERLGDLSDHPTRASDASPSQASYLLSKSTENTHKLAIAFARSAAQNGTSADDLLRKLEETWGIKDAELTAELRALEAHYAGRPAVHMNQAREAVKTGKNFKEAAAFWGITRREAINELYALSLNAEYPGIPPFKMIKARVAVAHGTPAAQAAADEGIEHDGAIKELESLEQYLNAMPE